MQNSTAAAAFHPVTHSQPSGPNTARWMVGSPARTLAALSFCLNLLLSSVAGPELCRQSLIAASVPTITSSFWALEAAVYSSWRLRFLPARLCRGISTTGNSPPCACEHKHGLRVSIVSGLNVAVDAAGLI